MTSCFPLLCIARDGSSLERTFSLADPRSDHPLIELLGKYVPPWGMGSIARRGSRVHGHFFVHAIESCSNSREPQTSAFNNNH